LQWHIASIVAEEMEPDTYPAGPAVKRESDTMVKNIPLPMSEQEEIERLKEDLETMENEYERLSVDSDMAWRRMRDELDKCRAALEAANKRIEELKRP
jgi:predicted RNase H-like nuclease (RuvC/YqgF family)